MHILLEGVMPYVVTLLLQHCIAEDLITIHQINARLMEFNYGNSQVKDKPETINPESGKHIAKDAAMMWMLFRTILFILYDTIEENEQQFAVVELLMKISSLLLAPVISL